MGDLNKNFYTTLRPVVYLTRTAYFLPKYYYIFYYFLQVYTILEYTKATNIDHQKKNLKKQTTLLEKTQNTQLTLLGSRSSTQPGREDIIILTNILGISDHGAVERLGNLLDPGTSRASGSKFDGTCLGGAFLVRHQ